MKWIKFISSLVISYVLGFTLNKGLSATNSFKGVKEWSYEVPYIFTIGLNEMFLILSITIILFLILNCYYSKSRASKEQLLTLLLKSIWLEMVIFNFIIGTLTTKILKDFDKKNIEFFECNWLIFPLLLLSILIFTFIIREYLKNKNINKSYTNDLYKQREILLKSISFYLKNTVRFSIVGEWGIGKTKLIDNFFKGMYFYEENDKKCYYKDEYTQIYIDVSSYSSNQKIIEILERELNYIFKEAKILKVDRNLSKEFFNISNNYIDLLKRIFIKEKSLTDSKEDLNRKIEEYQILKNKKLVICLDNLERIDDKERIIHLLSLIDEILSDNITRIYLYDEQYMEKLFGEEEFKKYIEKYSELKIRVNKLKTEEIIEETDKILQLIEKYKMDIEEILNESSKQSREIKEKIEVDKMIDRMYPERESKEKDEKKLIKNNEKLKLAEEKKNEIKKVCEDYQNKIYNPRYILGMKKFIESNYLGYSSERLFEYKLIIDLFSEFDLNNEILREIFFRKKGYKYIKKEEELNELHNGKIKKEEEKIEGVIKKLRKECENGLAKDLFNYIDYCKSNNVPIEKILEVLKEKRVYTIKNIRLFKELIKIYLYDGIDLNLLKNFRIEIQENFFANNKKYSEKESIEKIKIMLILHYLEEIKYFVQYIYNRKYKEISKLFEQEEEEFKKELKYKFGISFNRFMDKINNEFVIESNKKNNRLFEIIDKEEIKKEFLILNNLNIIFKERNSEMLKTKLTQEYFDMMYKKNNGIHIRSDIRIEKLEISIQDAIYEFTEIVNESNIEFYLQKIGEIKNNIEAKELLVEIYLLKQRIKHSKIKKIRPIIDKLKKYYKNN